MVSILLLKDLIMGDVMSESRFVYYKDSQMVLDRCTGLRYHCNDSTLVDLMNELWEYS